MFICKILNIAVLLCFLVNFCSFADNEYLSSEVKYALSGKWKIIYVNSGDERYNNFLKNQLITFTDKSVKISDRGKWSKYTISDGYQFSNGKEYRLTVYHEDGTTLKIVMRFLALKDSRERVEMYWPSNKDEDSYPSFSRGNLGIRNEEGFYRFFIVTMIQIDK